MAKRMKSFHVYAKLHVEASVAIKANSLEDAIAEAKNLKETDFIQFVGEFVDGDPMELRGVFTVD